MEIKIGTVVQSLAGHDKDELFYVISLEEGYALIVDGKSRRTGCPKRKNLKHLRAVKQNTDISEILSEGGRVPSSDIRKELSVLAAQIDV